MTRQIIVYTNNYALRMGEVKRAANLAKHGVDFSVVVDFAFGTAVIDPDKRHEYGEIREIALGLIGTRHHVLVFTRRENVIRVISLRKANARERKSYDAAKA